jgi:hypothetical protein
MEKMKMTTSITKNHYYDKKILVTANESYGYVRASLKEGSLFKHAKEGLDKAVEVAKHHKYQIQEFNHEKRNLAVDLGKVRRLDLQDILPIANSYVVSNVRGVYLAFVNTELLMKPSQEMLIKNLEIFKERMKKLTIPGDLSINLYGNIEEYHETLRPEGIQPKEHKHDNTGLDDIIKEFGDLLR